MSDWTPGEGWVEVADSSAPEVEIQWYGNPPGPDPIKGWKRERALPTEPYTVIRTGPMRWMKCALWHDGNMVGNPNAWLLLPGESSTQNRAIRAAHLQGQVIYDAKHLREQIDEFGFEVVAEPRAVTAKAVLDRVVERGITTEDDSYLEAVRIEFEVES